ncbi:MAG: SOS response-associated peptidase [Gemmatimonadota bacterium]
MCGRFSLATPRDVLIEAFGAPEFAFDYRPRYNIAPTQPVAALVRDDAGARIGPLRWGLIPHWADDPSIGNRMINARAETVHRKPSFRSAFRRRRCLILADGFYEWARLEDGGKAPYRIRRRDERPFAFAGLWERWRPDEEGEPIHSCTIITTDARADLRDIHPRMPVILPVDDRRRWLDDDAGIDALRGLLRPYPDDDLEAYRVSTIVNSPRNDGPECFEPA